MDELANCPKCGDLFVRNEFRDVCPNCFKEEEKEYAKISQYIRNKNNRTATMEEVATATGVERELILKFIKNERIRLFNN